MRWIVWAVVLAGFLANAAMAAGKLTLRPGMGGVPDLGAIRCETFTKILPEGPIGFRQAVLTWAEGYIYGKSGQTIDEVLASLPAGSPDWTFDTLTDHIVGYCTSNPAAPLPVAVQDLWARLNPVIAR